jgi:hypothetical protein
MLLTVTTFADELQALVSKKFESIRQFCINAEPDRSWGAAVSVVSRVVRGQAPPPLHTVPKWAQALGLEGDEAARFYHLAVIAHLPADEQAFFVDLMENERELRAEMRELYEKLADMEAALRQLRRAADGGPPP